MLGAAVGYNQPRCRILAGGIATTRARYNAVIPLDDAAQLLQSVGMERATESLRAPAFQRRFWSKVRKTAGCWIWTGSITGVGYGDIRLRSGLVSAHRASWLIANGGSVPRGRDICHRCDVRACVNPAHLFLGTRADNVHDCISKDRHARGSRNGQSKLSEVQVRAILHRLSRGERQRVIAADFGIGREAVTKIKGGRRWRHVREAV